MISQVIHSLTRHFLSTNIYQKAVRNCLCFQLLSVGGICQRTHHSDVIIGPGGRSPIARIIMTTTTLSDCCVWIHSKKQDWEKKRAQESFNLYIIETGPDPSGKASSFRIGYGWAFFLHGLGTLASFWQQFTHPTRNMQVIAASFKQRHDKCLQIRGW